MTPLEKAARMMVAEAAREAEIAGWMREHGIVRYAPDAARAGRFRVRIRARTARLALPLDHKAPETPDPTVARLRDIHWNWRMAEVPVHPHTVEVLGARWGGNAPWEGLDFARARVRERSVISGYPQHHLAVPWCHPNDRAMMGDDPCAWATYAVYPARDGWRFHRRDDGVWVLRRMEADDDR